MFTLAATAAALGAWLLAGAMVDYQQVSRLKRAVEIDILWFTVADKLAIERPMTGNALLAENPADTATMSALIPVQRDTDQAFAAVEQRILALSYPDAPHQLEIVRATRKTLTAWRDETRDMMTRPKRERDPDVFLHYVIALNAMLERLDSALDLGDVAASQQDGLTMDLLALSRQSWALRRVVGARSVPLMTALSDRVALSAVQIRRQGQFEGTIAAQWAAVDAFVLRLPDYPDVARSVAAAHTAFNAHDILCQDVLAAERAAPPIASPRSRLPTASSEPVRC